MSRASWLWSESVRVSEEDDEVMLPPEIIAGECGGVEAGSEFTSNVEMGGR